MTQHMNTGKGICRDRKEHVNTLTLRTLSGNDALQYDNEVSASCRRWVLGNMQARDFGGRDWQSQDTQEDKGVTSNIAQMHRLIK